MLTLRFVGITITFHIHSYDIILITKILQQMLPSIPEIKTEITSLQ